VNKNLVLIEQTERKAILTRRDEAVTVEKNNVNSKGRRTI